MVVAFHHYRYTLQDYLAVEEMGPVRHEFLDGAIFAMAGGTPEHAALSAAILVLLGTQLLGRNCRPYSADLRIRIPKTGLATYADAAVVFGPLERDPESTTHVTNPTVIVEVLSPSTEEYDRAPSASIINNSHRFATTCWSLKASVGSRCSPAMPTGCGLRVFMAVEKKSFSNRSPVGSTSTTFTRPLDSRPQTFEPAYFPSLQSAWS